MFTCPVHGPFLPLGGGMTCALCPASRSGPTAAPSGFPPRSAPRGLPPAAFGSTTLRFMAPESLCPDVLGLDYIGEADTLRGRVVRAFFWLMRAWPKPKGS